LQGILAVPDEIDDEQYGAYDTDAKNDVVHDGDVVEHDDRGNEQCQREEGARQKIACVGSHVNNRSFVIVSRAHSTAAGEWLRLLHLRHD